MPIFRMDESETFVPFEKTPFVDIERVLEDWIERNPQLLSEDDDIALFARQQRTSFGKIIDLLGVDGSGACVIIELKRNVTPRDVVAQTLEYAAWIDSLTIDELDEIARKYAPAQAHGIEGLFDLYKRAFDPGLEDELDAVSASMPQPSINERQRLIIMAEHFLPEVEQTIRYLRTKLGIDITGIQFGVHKTIDETIVETNVVVGREPVVSLNTKTKHGAISESDEMILKRARTDFVRRAVTEIEDWIQGLDHPQLKVQHSTGSNHMIKLGQSRLVFYYYARDWLYSILISPTVDEREMLQSRLSRPEEIQTQSTGDVRFHVTCDADLEVLKEIILARMAKHS